jgi:YesN/AraC family two-component response regulator
MDKFRILIVDDQRRARQSLRALLNTWQAVEEIREAANGLDAVLLVESFHPHLVLTDVRMLTMDGIRATRYLKAVYPSVKVIVLSMYPDYESQALDAGADAFVSKGESPERLLEVLEGVASEIEQA